MASESSLREKVQLPMLSPTEGLRRWFPKRSRFDFGTCRRWWVCASDRMQPRLGGTRLCIAVNTHPPPCRTDRALVPPGREELCFFPFLLSLCPTQSDDLHFILLYFLWFMLAASNYSFSFGKHYQPVLLY